MQKLLAHLFCIIICCATVCAQSDIRQTLLSAPSQSASNSVAYPTATKSLTRAPKGMKPFYLSHYGRHGSRYLTKTADYHYVPRVLRAAYEKGVLTALGKDVLQRTERLMIEAEGRWGDLTPLGARQHKDIAHRMVLHFPQIFRGHTHVDARSTLVPRCVLSMTNAIQQLSLDRPRLKITTDASPHDLYFMNYQDSTLRSLAHSKNTDAVYRDFCDRHWQLDRLMTALFNDTAYVRRHVNAEKVQSYLFRLAGSIQNTALCDSLTLYDIFTPDEIYNNWLTSNVWWFLGYGFTPHNGGSQPYTQRHLLRRLIADADSCILQSENNVQLRFGHDTMLLPLVCLMGVNGYGKPVTDLDSLALSGWIDYHVFPMAGNLQLVFYRRNAHDRDVWLKVLLNEEEATLPVATTQAPYYRWSDVRRYLLDILEKYPAND